MSGRFGTIALDGGPGSGPRPGNASSPSKVHAKKFVGSLKKMLPDMDVEIFETKPKALITYGISDRLARRLESSIFKTKNGFIDKPHEQGVPPLKAKTLGELKKKIVGEYFAS